MPSTSIETCEFLPPLALQLLRLRSVNHRGECGPGQAAFLESVTLLTSPIKTEHSRRMLGASLATGSVTRGLGRWWSATMCDLPVRVPCRAS